MQLSLLEVLATAVFVTAVLHTFASSRFQHLANRFREGSVGENLFHLLGEVEVVFGLWSGAFFVLAAVLVGHAPALNYLEGLNFTEPLFVFAIMTVSATRPVIGLTRDLILFLARLLPIPRGLSTYLSCLTIGPLLGSFITEPAAMTVTAFALRDLYFSGSLSIRARYITLAVLLVNISIGGVLTQFAAPPVLMVAGKWGWGLPFMLSHFGWKAIIAVTINAVLAGFVLRKELVPIQISTSKERNRVPAWLTVIHLLFLAGIVFYAHHPVLFIGLVLFFLGVTVITAEYQDRLRVRESLLVAFFLGGLVVLGGLQSWWLSPVIQSLDSMALFIGAVGLTAITDNAALTYLGAQVEGVTDAFKYALVAGAVTGGGLTVIANAPNPVAFSVLQEKFGADGISPLHLFVAALIPTFIAGIAFLFL